MPRDGNIISPQLFKMESKNVYVKISHTNLNFTLPKAYNNNPWNKYHGQY